MLDHGFSENHGGCFYLREANIPLLMNSGQLVSLFLTVIAFVKCNSDGSNSWLRYKSTSGISVALKVVNRATL